MNEVRECHDESVGSFAIRTEGHNRIWCRHNSLIPTKGFE